MKLSVIIPCKNEAKILPRLLSSLAGQTTLPDEVIVVDSHSTDNTVAVAKNFSTKLPLQIVTAKEKGISPARNEGVAKASGDLFLFPDADVTLPPTFIETFLREQKRRKLVAGGFTQRMPSKNKGIELGAHFMNAYIRLMQHTPWPIAFSCLFATRDVFEKNNGFDKAIYIMEDYDFMNRAKKHSAPIGIISKQHFIASDRRYVGDNPPPIWQGIYAELYRYTHGMRITKPLFRYEMGGEPKKEPTKDA